MFLVDVWHQAHTQEDVTVAGAGAGAAAKVVSKGSGSGFLLLALRVVNDVRTDGKRECLDGTKIGCAGFGSTKAGAGASPRRPGIRRLAFLHN